MRGTRRRGRGSGGGRRIIPAYAGNTLISSIFPLSARDHPRVCGEHRTWCRAPDTNRGSSPRMRGTQPIYAAHPLRAGIIPAYAGNTGMADIGDALSSGSSPRMRGTPPIDDVHDRRIGIIPAYAGNTPSTRCASHERRDHPRVCGEHIPTPCGRSRKGGSSPRMRGTRSGLV